MKTRYKGILFDISPLFFTVISLLLIFDKSGLMGISLVVSALHEASHIFVMILLKSAPLSVSVKCYGLEIKAPPCAKKQAILIAMAGPFSNLFVFAVSQFFFTVIKFEFLIPFSYMNLAIGVFNLLPISYLDGGDVTKELLSIFLNEKNTSFIVKLIGIVISLLLIAFGVLLAIKGNFSILLIGIFLFVLNLLNNN